MLFGPFDFAQGRLFGLDRYENGPLNTAYHYTGQRIESNTDLYFYGSRWYDPVVGRFLQPDSIVPEPGNPQALNRYAYTLNNPMRYTDPTGHSIPLSQRSGGPQVTIQDAGGVYMYMQPEYFDKRTHAALNVMLTGDERWANRLSSSELVWWDQIKKDAAYAWAALEWNEGFTPDSEGEVSSPTEINPLPGVVAVAAMAKMPGAGMPQIPSKTIWSRGNMRLDIENQAPGVNPGKIHFQQGKFKWDYNYETGMWDPYKNGPEAPGWLQKLIAKDRGFAAAMKKALYYQGLDDVDD